MSKNKKLENEFKKKDKSDKDKGNIIEIIIIIAGVLLVGSLLIMMSSDNTTNHIKEMSYSEYKEKIKSDEYTIVLIARDDCRHCISYKPYMNKVLDDYKLEAVYLNVGKVKAQEYYEIHDTLNALKDKYNEDNEPIIPTPTTVLFKGGAEIDNESGNVGYDGFLKFLVRNGVVN